jgi:hypothetical protein
MFYGEGSLRDRSFSHACECMGSRKKCRNERFQHTIPQFWDTSIILNPIARDLRKWAVGHIGI